MGKLLYAIEVLRKRGLIFFWIYFRESVWFDLRYGTATSSRVPKEQQTIDSDAGEQENGLLYVASFSSVTRDTLQVAQDHLGAEAFAESQFFDLGCGKGKALFVYALQNRGRARYPAIGIEYDAALVETGQQNLQKLGLGAGEARIVHDSATRLDAYLEAERAVIYIYNSFQGETLKAVLTLLARIPHVLIYVDPAERDRLADFGYQILAERKGRYNADTWLVACQT